MPRHGTDGANLICFTTGRGSTYGCKPVPSLKLATKSTLYRHMELDMDYDCGGIVDGRLSIAQAGEARARGGVLAGSDDCLKKRFATARRPLYRDGRAQT